MYCDTIYKNGIIFTMDKKVERAEWIAVKDGKILALGNGEPGSWEGRQVVDLQKKYVLPGFYDCHMHGTSTGEALCDVNLRGIKTKAEILETIAKACRRDDESWVCCGGFDAKALENGEELTLQELNAVSGKHPVHIKSMTLHGGFLNDKAMQILEIPEDLEGARRDEEGRLTGEMITDDATSLAAKGVHALIPDEGIRKYIRACADYCVSKGCTTLNVLDGGLFDHTDRDFFMWMNAREELPLHTNMFFQTENIHEAKALGLPRVGGCLCLDGAGFEGTMAMREPYNDGPYPCGILYWSDERLYQFLWKANKEGLQTAVHALGDAAVDQYLRVYERVYKELGLEGNPNRNRIEHFSMIWPEQIDKAVSMGLILSMQPMFTYQWDPEIYTKMMGEKRAGVSEHFRNIVDQGGIICGGSDSPVTLVSPLEGIHAACNLRNTEKRLSVYEAIQLFTMNGAIANREEKEKGSITPGKLADFVILDRNPYEEPEQIDQFRVLGTVVQDKFVYKAE